MLTRMLTLPKLTLQNCQDYKIRNSSFGLSGNSQLAPWTFRKFATRPMDFPEIPNSPLGLTGNSQLATWTFRKYTPLGPSCLLDLG